MTRKKMEDPVTVTIVDHGHFHWHSSPLPDTNPDIPCPESFLNARLRDYVKTVYECESQLKQIVLDTNIPLRVPFGYVSRDGVQRLIASAFNCQIQSIRFSSKTPFKAPAPDSYLPNRFVELRHMDRTSPGYRDTIEMLRQSLITWQKIQVSIPSLDESIGRTFRHLAFIIDTIKNHHETTLTFPLVSNDAMFLMICLQACIPCEIFIRT
jgi:hypothetical protein